MNLKFYEEHYGAEVFRDMLKQNRGYYRYEICFLNPELKQLYELYTR